MEDAQLKAIGDYQRALLCLIAYGATGDEDQRRAVLEKYYDAAVEITRQKVDVKSEEYYAAVQLAEASAKSILLETK